MLRNYYCDLTILVTSEKGQRKNGGRAFALFTALCLFKKERPKVNSVNITIHEK